MHYLLFYEIDEDYFSRRAQFREVHLQQAWAASEHGELLLAGALDKPDSPVLLFQGDSPEVAEKFARADPYVINGLVKRWYIRQWTTVVGEGAANPIRPQAAVATPKTDKGTIARMWQAQSTPEKEDEYRRYVTGEVFPSLRAIQGHRGAYLLRRAVAGAIELVVITFWESMEAVRRFAGAEADRAVVDPEAKPHLTSFDDFVTHFEVVYESDKPVEQEPRIKPGAE